MDKLTPNDGASPDIAAGNIEKLREIFPEVFADGSVDFDALKQTLGSYVDDREERYSFNWHGKSRARRIAQMPSSGTLLPCKEESVNWDSTKNIFIEGDNLEVLKILQKSYHRKVKMIYIDPPYNTGKDFIYPDKSQDNLDTYLKYTGQVDEEGFKLSPNAETSGRYHTNWLNMMYPRLKLARSLLRDDGVIFISIDDSEISSLRKLCDELFGEENFVAQLCWRRRKTQANLVKNIAPVHDFIIVYGRTEQLQINRLPYTQDHIEKIFKNPDSDPRGPYQTRPLAQPATSSNPEYEIELNDRKITAKWSCSRETFNRYVEEKRLFIPRGGQGMPRLKVFLSESKGFIANSWLSDLATTEEGSKELSNLFDGTVVFDFPKPVNLLTHLCLLGSGDNDLILDFFSGSCTTAHAVFNLNDEATGARKFIMVQLPQPCSEKSAAFKAGYKTIDEIGKERIRRVIKKIKEEKPDSKGDLGFRVFKLSSSNIKLWDTDFEELDGALLGAIDNIKPDRSQEDVLYELLLKYGLDLPIPVDERTIAGKTVFIIGAGALVVCLDSGITLDVVRGIAELKTELKPEIMRVVFKDSGFANDVVKTNTVQILKQAGVDDVKSL